MALSDDEWVAEARRQFTAGGSWMIPVTPPARPPEGAVTHRCPRCEGGPGLAVFLRYDVASSEPLRYCPHCFGFWAAADALDHGVADPGDEHEALFAAEAPRRCRLCREGRLKPDGTCRACGRMQPAAACPACGKEMAREQRNGVEIDTCADCRGTWFDIGELGRLYGAARPQGWGAATVDEAAAPSEASLILQAIGILARLFAPLI